MKLRISLCCMALLPAVALAQTYTVNVAQTVPSGNKIRGPVTVRVRGVNGLRRNAQLQTTTTYPAGPSLSGIPFIPPIPSSGPQNTVAPAATISANPAVKPSGAPRSMTFVAPAVQSTDIEDIFSGLVAQLNDL